MALVAVGHYDDVEQRPRYLLGEQHGKEADQGQGLPHEAQGIGDHQVRDGQQPLHQGPPPGDVEAGVQLQLERIGDGHGHGGSLVRAASGTERRVGAGFDALQHPALHGEPGRPGRCCRHVLDGVIGLRRK